MLPLSQGFAPVIEMAAQATENCQLIVSLRKSSKHHNYTPDVILKELEFTLDIGDQKVLIDFETDIKDPAYYFICFHKNEHVSVQTSKARITGLLCVFNKQNKAVSNFGRQDPDPKIGFEDFEFWVPIRRPEGQNIAMKITPEIGSFDVNNLTNGFFRPYLQSNAWVAQLNDTMPEIHIEWHTEVSIQTIVLHFDPDWDHAMESSIWGHSERVVPFTINQYQISDGSGNLIHEINANHQAINVIELSETISVKKLIFRFTPPSPHVPVALFGLQIHPPQE